MAEEIERRGDRTPQRQAPEKRQPLFGHAHSFGVAAEVDRYRSELSSSNGSRPTATPAVGSHHPRRDAVLDHLLNPLARRGKGPGSSWHRFKCRCGRHEMQGGHLMQVSGDTVFIPRRCRWCDTGSCA